MKYLKLLKDYVLFTKIGKFFFFSALSAICAYFSEEVFWLDYLSILFLLYPAGLTVVLFVYAFIINPIRNYKENKKYRKK